MSDHESLRGFVERVGQELREGRIPERYMDVSSLYQLALGNPAVEKAIRPEPEAPEGERYPDRIEVETNELPWDRFQRIVADTRDGTRPPTTSDWRWVKQALTEHFNEPAPPEQTEGEPCTGSIADALEAEFPMLHVEADPEEVVRAVLRLHDEIHHPDPMRRVSREEWDELRATLIKGMDMTGDAWRNVDWIMAKMRLAVGIEIEGEEGGHDG